MGWLDVLLRFELNRTARKLQGLRYPAGADAAGAYLDGRNGAVSHCLNFLEIRMPGSGSFVICMAHVVTEAGAFSTDGAYLRHFLLSSFVD
jgi:hypothetical protein